MAPTFNYPRNRQIHNSPLGLVGMQVLDKGPLCYAIHSATAAFIWTEINV